MEGQRTKDRERRKRASHIVLCRLSFVLNPLSFVLCLMSFNFKKFVSCGRRVGLLE